MSRIEDQVIVDEQTAQNIRIELETALAVAFPGTEFQVEVSPEPMPNGGPMLEVKWQNGPSRKRVREVCAPFDTDVRAPRRSADATNRPRVSIASRRRYTEEFYRAAVARAAEVQGIELPRVVTRDGSARLHFDAADPQRMAELFHVMRYIADEVNDRA